MFILALDIGGTQLRAALYTRHPIHLIRQERVPTRAAEGGVTQRLDELIASIWPSEGRVELIAAAVPGPISPDGYIYSAPNIPEWRQFHIRQHLMTRFQTPVVIGNDANLAALGEWREGAGRGYRHMLYLTISTGIGGGIISDGHLLTGSQGLGAEFGHVPVTAEGPLCSCGQPGHLEAYASGTAISRYVQQEIAAGRASSLSALGGINTRSIAEAARQGDGLALEAMQRAGFYLGVALSGFIHLFNPEIIVLGGGVSQSGDLLFAPLKKTLGERIMRPVYLEHLLIKPAVLGDDAGLKGALALAQQTLRGDFL